ncbi:siderophore-interacting protein [Cryobacterium lactosi]|uniref:Siderophore-interacting protein n=1 Tax=Cryobacterium lactosi TaxID=1259202 RepID=A0A4R9BJ11_9MICO|nr:siderophore-interacting protein [Cryobacterium lactosi]TFD85725.1 siderophore-interacting protein [Cryobacterium lactosi]
MLTSTVAPAPAPARVRAPRPSYRPFAVSVARVQRLSTNFTRVTFTGPDLHEFGTAGLDQRIKIVLPLPGVGVSSFPRNDSWYETWRDLPDERRNPIRTYTVRHARPEHREVDIDFVTHGDAGPASRWVRAAIVGDEVAIVGPVAGGDNPVVGIEWAPGSANTVLIAGDETAAPAICAILSALPRTARGCAYIEVPEAGDAHDTNAPDGVTVTWLPRNGADHGSALEAAVKGWTARFITAHHSSTELPDIDIDESIIWEVPDGSALDGELYAWLAGEASVIKRLRRFVVSEVGIDRRQVAFMGYWRDGRAEHA